MFVNLYGSKGLYMTVFEYATDRHFPIYMYKVKIFNMQKKECHNIGLLYPVDQSAVCMIFTFRILHNGPKYMP